MQRHVLSAVVALLAGSLLAGCCQSPSAAPASCCPTKSAQKVQRYGWVIQVKPEKLAYYKDLHAHPWPAVNKMIKECNIRNYSIYLREIEPGKWYLFSYLEYTGTDFKADAAKMAKDPETQRWWKETDPCQKAIPLAKKGEWWSDMEEVYHLD